MSLLGIDIGTTGCKAAAYAAGGGLLAAAYREYPTLHPGAGEAELDSRAVWKKVKSAIAEVAAATREDPVRALSAGSLGEAVTPVTRGRRILGNAILCSDTRGAESLAPLRALGEEALYRINPNIPGPQYTAPKLLWLREHMPELYGEADTFLHWADLAAFLLGGEARTCHSLANRTLLFDIRREDWSETLLSRTGIAREKLAPCVAAGEIIGTVSDALASETGLPRGTRIVSGGHDQCQSALGAGAAQAGRAVDGIGTFECITPVYSQIPEASAMLAGGLSVEHHVAPGLYVSFLYNQGGALVRWFRDTFAADLAGGETLYDRLAAEMPTDPTRLFTLPTFEPTGPPHFLTETSGVILGLKTDTARGEILKSIMESVTYYLAGSVGMLEQAGVDTSRFVATGGGAKSDAWMQIKADILGVPYVRPMITECGTLGAAILAGTATGEYGSLEEGIASCVREERIFEPDAQRHRIYKERLEQFNTLIPLLRQPLQSLDRMQP